MPLRVPTTRRGGRDRGRRGGRDRSRRRQRRGPFLRGAPPTARLGGHGRARGVLGTAHPQVVEADLQRRVRGPLGERGPEADPATGADVVARVVAHELPAVRLGRAARPDLEAQLRGVLADGLEADVDRQARA